MQCDMCGAESELYKAEIEGTELSVCKNCSKYGKIISSPKPPAPKKPKKPQKKQEDEVIEVVVEEFPKLIKQKREEAGLKQKELAAKMAERESLIQKVETGHFTPSLELARKFEKLFNLKLIEKVSNAKPSTEKTKTGKLTIGDVIKLKN